MSLRQPGCTSSRKGPLGFAPPPRGRFALVQDIRKYTGGRKLVAIGLMGVSHGRRLMGARALRRYATLRRSLHHALTEATKKTTTQAPFAVRHQPQAARTQTRFGVTAQRRLVVHKQAGLSLSRAVRAIQVARVLPAGSVPAAAYSVAAREETKSAEWLCLVVLTRSRSYQSGARARYPTFRNDPGRRRSWSQLRMPHPYGAPYSTLQNDRRIGGSV